MDALSIGRTAVKTSISLAKIPLDLASKLLGENESPAAKRQRERAQRLRRDADRREATASKVASEARENLEELVKRERLEQLEDEADSLRERERAQTAEDEAERLEKAAKRVKTARKS